MANETSQKGRDNLQQTNVENMTVVVGVSEERVRAIVDEKLQVALENFSEEANHVARQRNEKFSEKLISRMVEKKALEAFADPSFQILLMEAQKRAASTERECDYELLAELMVRRFESGGNRLEKAGISKAVEIVDQISDDALLGLTILHAVLTFAPTSGDISKGLKTLDSLYGKILYMAPPTGDNWLDHLDILGAVRISTLGRPMPFENCLIQKVPGYLVGGIEKESESFCQVIDQLRSAGLNEKGLLVDHELAENHVRLQLVDEEQIKGILVHTGGPLAYGITQPQQEIMKEIFSLSNKTQIVTERVVEEIDKYPNIKQVREWWNKLESGFRITGIGRVLAHANAQRIDNTLPPFIIYKTNL